MRRHSVQVVLVAIMVWLIPRLSSAANSGRWQIAAVGEGQNFNFDADVIDASAGVGVTYDSAYVDTGSFFIRLGTQPSTLQSTDKRVFGRFLLAPAISNVSFSLATSWLPWELKAPWGLWHGFSGYFTGGFSKWSLPDDYTADLPETAGEPIAAMALSFGARWVMRYCNVAIDDMQQGWVDHDGNIVKIFLFAGPTFRYLGSDVSQDDNDEVRELLLGVDSTFFFGFDLGFEIRINDNIAVSMSIPFLWGPRGEDVPGLTSGQFLPSTGVFGAIILQ